jgi:hypothetical protein
MMIKNITVLMTISTFWDIVTAVSRNSPDLGSGHVDQGSHEICDSFTYDWKDFLQRGPFQVVEDLIDDPQ